jgi:hypothetical protein
METTNSEFVVFILTHGRPDRVVTLNTLRRQGYTGKIYFIVDNEDKAQEDYRARFGDSVIIFDKADIARRYDTGDNFNDRRAVFYARNACFEIAQSLGIRYFFQFDDDYSDFVYKFDWSFQYKERRVYSLDKLFSAMLEYYKKIPARAIAFAQNGDYIGGRNNRAMGGKLMLRRKCMNTFLCSTDRPFSFVGRVNEDVNTYTSKGNKGDLFLTVPNVAIIQGQTQKNKGGMSEMYRQEGTYIKTFYSVMYCPSAVKVGMMGHLHRRIHHKISWKNAVPCLISEKLRN